MTFLADLVRTLVNGILLAFPQRGILRHPGAEPLESRAYAARVIGLVREAGVTIASNPHISRVLARRRDAEPVRGGQVVARTTVTAEILA